MFSPKIYYYYYRITCFSEYCYYQAITRTLSIYQRQNCCERLINVNKKIVKHLSLRVSSLIYFYSNARQMFAEKSALKIQVA